MTPTTEHITGFFHGYQHAISVAEKNKRGRTSAQVRAMNTDYATLRLAAEVKRINMGGRIDTRERSVERSVVPAGQHTTSAPSSRNQVAPDAPHPTFHRDMKLCSALVVLGGLAWYAWQVCEYCVGFAQ